MTIKSSRDISTLLEIMAALRDPDSGCPWDLEQDFSTIAPYTIEEAYEVADAIAQEDHDELRLELGDLLLQSVYHAQMAKEAGHFDFGDVVEGITAKMIRRHPHVFGTADKTAAEYSAQGLAEGTWERIKSEEKAEQAARRAKMGLPPKQKKESILDHVPNTMPAILVAEKIQNKAAKIGFDWDEMNPVFDKLIEEIEELRAEMQSGDKETQSGELGDVLFAIVNLARHLKIDPEAALRSTNDKFRKRFAAIEREASRTGKLLADMTLEEMEEIWQSAKATSV